MAILAGSLMGVKDPDKVRNQRVAKSQIVLIILVKQLPQQLIHGCKYCSINNTSELCLLVSTIFGVKKNQRDGQISSKNNSIQARTSVFISSPQPLPLTDDWIESFYIALFKSRNYGNYINVHMHFISC